MIKYKLKCLECSKEFDSWFNSSIEYEKLKKKNFLKCHLCGSQNIGKTIMSPNISNSINKINNSKNSKKQIEIKKKNIGISEIYREKF